jgi:hypothetical protein
MAPPRVTRPATSMDQIERYKAERPQVAGKFNSLT